MKRPSIHKVIIIFCVFGIVTNLSSNIVFSEPFSSSTKYYTSNTPATNFEWNKDISENYPIAKQIRYTMSIQNLENRLGKEVKLWIYAPSNKTSHQVLKRLKTSYPASVSQDKNGNVICEFSIPEILPYDTKIFRLSAELSMREIPITISLDDPSPYLQPERLIESDHPLIQEKAKDLKKGDNSYKTARSIYEWVSDNIKTNVFLTDDKGALYAMENREGDCTECASLFVALCRAAGIPARMLSGYICERNCIVTTIDFHHWAEFYLEGAWRLADPHNRRFDQGGEDYIITEIYTGDNKNPIGEYHRYRFEGKGVRFKVKMTN